MTTLHELLQGTDAQDRSVMSRFGFAKACISRGKQFFQRRFLRDVIADHRVETHRTADLAKVDLLYYSHALKRRGLFDNVEIEMKHLHKRGDVVNVFQLSMSKGLLLEGKATIVKPIGSPQDEHYMVFFHSDLNKYPPDRYPTYERFIDRDGQDDPLGYIEAFNKRLTTPA